MGPPALLKGHITHIAPSHQLQRQMVEADDTEALASGGREQKSQFYLPLEISFAATLVASLNPQGVSLNQEAGQRNHQQQQSRAGPQQPPSEALKGQAAAYI